MLRALVQNNDNNDNDDDDDDDDDVHLSCAHQRPERSHDIYSPKYNILYTVFSTHREVN